MYPKRTDLHLSKNQIRESRQQTSTRSCLELVIVYARASLESASQVPLGTPVDVPLRMNSFACHQVLVRAKAKYANPAEYSPGTFTNAYWNLCQVQASKSFKRMFTSLKITPNTTWRILFSNLPAGASEYIRTLQESDDTLVSEVYAVLTEYSAQTARGKSAKHIENQLIYRTRQCKLRKTLDL